MPSNIIPVNERSNVPPETLVTTALETTTLPSHDGSNPEKTTIDCDSEKQIPSRSETSSSNKDLRDEMEYPPARKTILIMLSLYLTMFLMALVGDDSEIIWHSLTIR